MYDVIIIGAGVSGAATARELSRYKVKACVIEKEEDVCCGTSKANSAIVHAGYDAAEGSLMAKLNVRGNQMMEQTSNPSFPEHKRNSFQRIWISHLRKMARWLYVCMKRICRIFRHCMTEALQMVLRS